MRASVTQFGATKGQGQGGSAHRLMDSEEKLWRGWAWVVLGKSAMGDGRGLEKLGRKLAGGVGARRLYINRAGGGATVMEFYSKGTQQRNWNTGRLKNMKVLGGGNLIWQRKERREKEGKTWGKWISKLWLREDIYKWEKVKRKGKESRKTKTKTKIG